VKNFHMQKTHGRSKPGTKRKKRDKKGGERVFRKGTGGGGESGGFLGRFISETRSIGFLQREPKGRGRGGKNGRRDQRELGRERRGAKVKEAKKKGYQRLVGGGGGAKDKP